MNVATMSCPWMIGGSNVNRFRADISATYGWNIIAMSVSPITRYYSAHIGMTIGEESGAYCDSALFRG